MLWRDMMRCDANAMEGCDGRIRWNDAMEGCNGGMQWRDAMKGCDDGMR